MHKEARNYFETNIGPTPTNEEGDKYKGQLLNGTKSKKTSLKDSTHLAEQPNNLNSNATI